jgi:hypothetical protein
MTIIEKARLFTPIACRLLARRTNERGSVVAMTDREIQQASGLPMATVKHLSWCPTWDGIEFTQMMRFTRACGVSFDDRNAVRNNARYLRQGGWSHILRSPERTTFYRDLLAEWRKNQ